MKKLVFLLAMIFAISGFTLANTVSETSDATTGQHVQISTVFETELYYPIQIDHADGGLKQGLFRSDLSKNPNDLPRGFATNSDKAPPDSSIGVTRRTKSQQNLDKNAAFISQVWLPDKWVFSSNFRVNILDRFVPDQNNPNRIE